MKTLRSQRPAPRNSSLRLDLLGPAPPLQGGSRYARPALLALCAAAWLTTAASPAAAQKQEPIEKYRARAVSLDRGAAKNLDIVIYEWTTPEERQALIETFREGGGKALYDTLNKVSRKAYLKLPQTLAYDMQYAWQVEHQGKRRIVLATDRPMGFLELARNRRSTDYNVSLVVLELDPETGEGEGSATGGAELSIDEETGRLDIKYAGTRPTKLTKVTPRKIKGKGGG